MPTPAQAVKRLTTIIARYGGMYPYKRGAFTTMIPARIRPMTGGEKYEWFTAAEVSAWAAPAYVITLAGDFKPFGADPATGDKATIAGTDYTVKKWDKTRLGSVVLKTTLYCAA